MLALNITNLKDFTNKLFIGEVFDHFLVTEASITTFGTFFINGTLQNDFFDSDEQTALHESGRSYALWKEIKPYCCSVIRGKRLPLHFKIIFQLPHSEITRLFPDKANSLSDIGNFYLNIQYRNQNVLCTTGVSLHTFTPGVKPDPLWDDMILQFMQNHQIDFEKISD